MITVVGKVLFTWLLSTVYVPPLIVLIMETSIVKRLQSRLRRTMDGGQEGDVSEAVTEVRLDVAQGNVIM